MPLRDHYLLFLDLETTGLDPVRDLPLEVGLLLVRAVDLEVMWSFVESPLKTPVPAYQLAMSDVVRAMHDKSGLLAAMTWPTGAPAIAGPAVTLEEALASALNRMAESMEWVPSTGFADATCFKENWITLAGYSIHFDRAFLKHHAPQFEARCHHQMLDVSSLRRCAKEWAPGLVGEQGVTHRALDDCYTALDELRLHKRHYEKRPL